MDIPSFLDNDDDVTSIPVISNLSRIFLCWRELTTAGYNDLVGQTKEHISTFILVDISQPN